jgi:shikimate dehydrogenase
MRKFGLIGYPLGHSFSKKYFAEKFQKEDISDCIYENYPLSDVHQISELVDLEGDLCGFNVTIPYKSEIIKFLDKIDTEAEEIGAVNVVKIHRSDGRPNLYGYNSDVTGIRISLRSHITRYMDKAIILGTGGSSKSVAHVLKNWGMNVIFVSRHQKPGTISYEELNAGMISEANIIVNATPSGMFPNIDTCPELRYDLLKSDQILFDLVYNPEETKFLKKGAERGCITIGGINMLHAQAERAWEIWNDENL